MKKMAGELLIKNGHVIDPANGVDKKCDVLVVDGKIAKVGKIEKDAEKVIDASGKLVTPGLIDIHVHFREPGDEEEETIASGTAAAVAAVQAGSAAFHRPSEACQPKVWASTAAKARRHLRPAPESVSRFVPSTPVPLQARAAMTTWRQASSVLRLCPSAIA